MMLTVHFKRTGIPAILLMTAALAAGGCVAQQPVHEADNRSYISYTGSDLVKEQIQEAFESVKRIHNNVVYRTYLFDEEHIPLKSDLVHANLRRLSSDSFTENHSSAGTAIILSNRNERISLLTAAHTVTFPDTIWHYHHADHGGGERVGAVSVKQSEAHFLFYEGGAFSFDVIVSDTRRDLALLMRRWGNEGSLGVKPLAIPPGNHAGLDWTDLVYALGYPKGIQMVTSAMVSKFPVPLRHSFVLDASFNRGFSGGALFTVRNDGTGLEWIGILTAAYAENEYLLVPEEISDDEYKPNLAYTGKVYVQREQRINYGITYAAGMDEIGSFFRENNSVIRRNGITVPDVPR